MLHHADVTLTDDALRLRLRGLAVLGALRRTVVVPYRSIEAVEVGPVPTRRPLLWRLGGLAYRDVRFGTFRRGGRWMFLAARGLDRVVHVRLDGDGPERVRFAEVAFSAADPEACAAAIRRRLAA